jgi:GT2 family glycosyltransferase
MQLSVVMPTYNRPDALPRALDALSRQTLDPARFEVVIVEDANNEAPPEIGERAFAVRLLRGTQPGVSSARNVGWRAAQAPLVLFLGDDILGAPDLLEQHVAWHQQHPEETAGVLGHVRWARELKGRAFMRWLDRGIQFDYGTIAGSEAGPGHFYTANVSLKRSMLERSGGFDEDGFPFGYEDIDLGLRLFEHGFRLLYNRSADAEHLHQPRLEEWQKRMARTAGVERRWIERYPDERPYFHDLFADAVRRPPVRGRKGRALMGVVPRSMPVVGEWIWANGDLYFRQQLGRPFMDAWNSDE